MEGFDDLIPADREEFEGLFRMKHDDDDFDFYHEFYKNELRSLLRWIHPDITWDKNTKNVIVKKFGEMKGLKILTLLNDFINLEPFWYRFESEDNFREDLLSELKDLIQIKMGRELEVYSF